MDVNKYLGAAALALGAEVLSSLFVSSSITASAHSMYRLDLTCWSASHRIASDAECSGVACYNEMK